MITRLIKNKLSEQRGVSIVIALFALIVIVVISTLVLNSALSNVGRVRRNQQAEQNYLTTASAAELVKKFFNGDRALEIHYSKTLDEDDNEISTDGPDFTDSYTGKTAAEFENPFKADLLEWFKANAINGNAEKLDEYYYMKLDGSTALDGNVAVNDVLIHVTMEGIEFDKMDKPSEDVDGGTSGSGDSGDSSSDSDKEKRQGTANLILSFSLADPDNNKRNFQNYRMSMNADFNCVYESEEITESSKDPVTGDDVETTKTVYNYTFKFEKISEINKGNGTSS